MDFETKFIFTLSILRNSAKFATCLLLCFTFISYTQAKDPLNTGPRVKYTINEDWRFIPIGKAFGYRSLTDDSGAELISIPHTWNTHDPFDGKYSYHRGISWYRKKLVLNEDLKGKRLFLYFEGANQVADVYINSVFAGQHKGGYTAFVVDITDYAIFGKDEPNLIAVQVDNSHDNYIPPLSVGYALYGGIYRDVWLLATDQVHFNILDHASSGIFVSTPEVSKEKAVIDIKGTIVNQSHESRKLKVISRIMDNHGKLLESLESVVQVEPSSETNFHQFSKAILNPRLWSPDDPYLYKVVSEIHDGNSILDEVTNPLGFRWFSFDPENGFSLNGEKLQLRGTNRHQDMMGKGHALTNTDHERDLRIIKEMGCNFLRLAHYPQDPYVLEMADKLGLLIWEEVPLVNYMNISHPFLENSKNMIREMIRQHFNHPSVIMWGSMNEIFLWSEEGARTRNHTDEKYNKNVFRFAKILDSLIRAEDTDRYTVMAIHGSDHYDKTGVADIPQVLGLNLYNGWYGGVFEGFGKTLDKRHKNKPNHIIFVSEYGAGSDKRLNSLNPRRFDFTGNWQRLYHEEHLRQINERPYLAGTAIWNQFDFSQPHTGGSIIQRNQKGLLTWDRQYKDCYYLYKANWNPEPMVYIASRDWTRRTGTNPDAHTGAGYAEVTQPVDVYTNLERIELKINGKSLGRRYPDRIGKITWDVPFNHGVNVLEAYGKKSGKIYTDRLEIHFIYRPTVLKYPSVPFHTLGINVGGNAQFTDQGEFVWEADQPYKPGSFGYIDGIKGEFNKDLIIYNTENTPLYYTYLEDLTAYQLDVPDGEYEVELHFAESQDIKPGERTFTVYINNQVIFNTLDLTRDYGFRKAFFRTFIVNVKNDESLRISFKKITGVPLLNAIKVTRK